MPTSGVYTCTGEVMPSAVPASTVTRSPPQSRAGNSA